MSVGHASVSAGKRAEGTAALMHIIAIVMAVAVPLLLLLDVLSEGDESITGWKLYDRVDIIVLIFCVLAVLVSAASLLFAHRRSLGIAAAALLFATFGLLLPLPLESVAQSDASVSIGAWLSAIAALVGAGASVYAAELAPLAAEGPLVGAGRGPNPAFSTPLVGAGAGAPAPSGPPQAPSGGGIAPGWYDDPHRQARLRYYDGQNWTEQTSN